MASKMSVSCSHGISSTHVTLNRIFHNGLLDTACDKLLNYHCHNSNKQTLNLDSSARAFLMDYIVDIMKNLCEPSAPHSVNDVCDRLDYSFPSKLRPSDPLIEEFRLLAERGKKKTLYLPHDKVISCLKFACPRIEQSAALFLTHLIEHTLSQIILWAVNFEAKLQSGIIEYTDIQHVCTLFGTPKMPKFSVCQTLPFLHRQSADYTGHAKELQFFLRTTVEHLGIVVRVFGDSLFDEMAQLSLAAESTSTGMAGSCEIVVAAGNLFNAVTAAQSVFSRASELYSHMTLLSECVDDVFEGQTRLLGSCLIEPAEDETFHSFAYYSEALFSSDFWNWTLLLTQAPCMVRALNTIFQNILRTVMEKASSRRLVDLETRYADPHSCGLCASSNASDSGPPYSSGVSTGTSYSNSSHLADSPQSTAGSLPRVHNSGAPCQSVTDPPGSIPMPFSSCTARRMSRCTASPSCHSLGTFRQPRAGHTGTTSTNTSLQRRKKSWTTRRSVSGSPSPPSQFLTLSTSGVGGGGEASEYTNAKHSMFLEIKPSEVGMSTSSSSSSALNEGGVKSSQGSESHSFEHTRGLVEPDDHSNLSTCSMKDMQARLMELFPASIYAGGTTASCSHMVIAFRYLLPQLLQLPTLQLFYLIEIIEALYVHATEENEQSMLKDVLCMLSKTRLCIQNSMSTHDWVKSMAPRLANFLKTPLSGSVLSAEAKSKLDDIIQSVSRNQSSSERPILVSEFIMG
ncbi:putative ras GTP exchange factor son of sevenless, partial [Fasciola hepatica]